ncbi:hypothetical protein [Nocardia sp. MW-W600-9]
MISNEQRAVADQLAAQLPGDWTATPIEYGLGRHMALVNTAGARVVVLDGDAKWGWAQPGRWTFVGLKDGLYDHVKHNQWPNDINIAKSKRPALIAREVQRRLLERFVEVHAEALANKAAKDEKAAAWVQLLNDVAAALGPAVEARVWADNSRHGTPQLYSPQVQAEAHGRGGVQVKLSVPSDRVVELAELLGLFFTASAATLQAA